MGCFFLLIPAFLFAAVRNEQREDSSVSANNARGRIQCGADETLEITKIYNTVPPNKSLLTSPQFLVIDDFANYKEWKNRLHNHWRLENGKARSVTMEHSREDGREMRPGQSLKILFELDPRQHFTLSTSLGKLDMSKARFLAMKCKLKPNPKHGFNGRIRVSLTDWTGRSVTRDITETCAKSEKWQEAILPVEYFKGLDFDQLDRLSITVLGRHKRSKANLWLDDIVFFGHNEVGSESVLDNIKDFPKVVKYLSGKQRLLSMTKDSDFLNAIGQDTWRYFEEAANKENHLVLDHIKVGDFPMVGVYTSPTNIAMDLICTVAARELGYISKESAQERAHLVLDALQKLPRWRGFFYNFYETNKLSINRKFISSVDNAWLAAALIVTRQAFSGAEAKRASKILEEMNFEEFYDPDTNHIAIGYDLERAGLTPYHYGMMISEARIISFIGIGKGDIPKEHWWYLFRTAPDAWDWQTQKPSGQWVTKEGVEYFQGYYTVDSKEVVPSWGGSLFEFLMPTLIIPEDKLSPESFGRNNRVATEIHRDYALNEKEYPVWGISPAAVSNGRRWFYGEYGIKKLGTKGYPEKAIIAPYAALLALETLPGDAVKNLRKMLELYDIYGEYGFYDSINLKNDLVTNQYLSLDQGMSLIAIANYLKKGIIQNFFMKDPIAQKAQSVFEGERFFKDRK